ncbi:MAG: hypothetical protein RM049_26750 [Nostoc sp. DedQUE04]|uniref:hypothetical protein n=1 Tax=Nostoc sp. DedQUE04 TaxID=3075390 RepID=UPI002AD447B0|nr:hypothetical protein [Nostoc sp. DedQUE04]MDZ8138860.1 hypothetical protein [Nostoc sp. DedQUE04]
MKHIKTRIKTNSRAGKAAERVAGVTVEELKKALTGDQATLKKLGSMYQEGKMAAALMPSIIETVKTKIGNEREWNKFLGEFVTDGSKAEVDIQKAKRDASLSNIKYLNGMSELSEQFKAALEMEQGRHGWAIDYNRAKLLADMIIQDVEGQVRLAEQRSRIYLKQIKEDEVYELKVAQHLLENGDRADLSLIHKRDYSAIAKSPVGIFQRLRNALGI